MLIIKEMEFSDGEEFTSFTERYESECGSEEMPFGLNPGHLPYDEFFGRISSLSDRDSLPVGWVPTRYFLIRKDSEIIGAANIRYEDSDFVLNYSGHIGYCIAPWQRRKGYATQALKAMLPIAASLGLARVLLTCDHDNAASKKVIEKNGGVFERRTDQKEFYWITL